MPERDGGLNVFNFGGKSYEDVARAMISRFQCDSVVFVVIGGRRGSGAVIAERHPARPTARQMMGVLLQEMYTVLGPDDKGVA
jgi:hypothetical protein